MNILNLRFQTSFQVTFDILLSGLMSIVPIQIACNCQTESLPYLILLEGVLREVLLLEAKVAWLEDALGPPGQDPLPVPEGRRRRGELWGRRLNQRLDERSHAGSVPLEPFQNEYAENPTQMGIDLELNYIDGMI